MAKTAKVKKRQVTVHSRAARRAASPSIDLDKNLKKTTRDSASPSRPSQANPHVLAAQNGGIQKKKNNKNMTRAQRLRHQKGLERAAENLDKMQVKVVKSLGKEQLIKERSKGWEDVNAEGLSKKKNKKNANGTAQDDADTELEKKEREWVSDEDMGDTVSTEPVKEVESVPASTTAAPVEEDELL